MKVVNIDTSGHHYLIHAFFKDFTSKDIHAYSYEQLNEKVTELYHDPKIYDIYIFKGIDFDLERNYLDEQQNQREKIR